jgi:hypothetical protein
MDPKRGLKRGPKRGRFRGLNTVPKKGSKWSDLDLTKDLT